MILAVLTAEKWIHLLSGLRFGSFGSLRFILRCKEGIYGSMFTILITFSQKNSTDIISKAD